MPCYKTHYMVLYSCDVAGYLQQIANLIAIHNLMHNLDFMIQLFNVTKHLSCNINSFLNKIIQNFIPTHEHKLQ